MRRRFTFTDIHDYRSPRDVHAAVERNAVCYIEGRLDPRLLSLLAGPRLSAFVRFKQPQDDFDDVSDGHSGVFAALEEQARRQPKSPYFGLCDGDALSALGRSELLLDARSSFMTFKSAELGAGRVVFLGFHEIENIAFCKTDAIGHAVHFSKHRTEPGFETQLRRSTLERARVLFDEALDDFAESAIHHSLGPKSARQSIADDEYAHLIAEERIRQLELLRSVMGSVHPADRRSTVPDGQLLRLCKGKELLQHLVGEAKLGTSFLDILFVALRAEKIGRDFQKLLRQQLRMLLGDDPPVDL
ncbi:hypothetical protein [Methylobacterium brachythecii]|uniref:Uncharacterized protein n=1 Tax=Methylobacterium brachythecii TaxID=1176177 RepID=A0A7W6AIG3_9HYPH|nr:hypothetical protein [Methylobacterium brachythecii]MBB3903970.1 hypothetical protein [Methylobacterium brachythecii]GLS42715.1 hypothetical protein GCM10007884_07000 [Methylobacterium brachythecii]